MFPIMPGFFPSPSRNSLEIFGKWNWTDKMILNFTQYLAPSFTDILRLVSWQIYIMLWWLFFTHQWATAVNVAYKAAHWPDVPASQLKIMWTPQLWELQALEQLPKLPAWKFPNSTTPISENFQLLQNSKLKKLPTPETLNSWIFNLCQQQTLKTLDSKNSEYENSNFWKTPHA